MFSEFSRKIERCVKTETNQDPVGVQSGAPPCLMDANGNTGFNPRVPSHCSHRPSGQFCSSGEEISEWKPNWFRGKKVKELSLEKGKKTVLEGLTAEAITETVQKWLVDPGIPLLVRRREMKIYTHPKWKGGNHWWINKYGISTQWNIIEQ